MDKCLLMWEICRKDFYFRLSPREEDILGLLRHENIVMFYGRIDKPGDKKNRTVWLAMELCHWSLGDLIKRKRDLKWIPVSSLMRQIAQALKYMHGKKIAHR